MESWNVKQWKKWISYICVFKYNFSPFFSLDEFVFPAFNKQVCNWFQSVLLSSDARHARSIQIGRIVGVHSRMNPHVLHIFKGLFLHERIRGACHHLAHIICLLAEKLVGFAPFAEIAAFLAPEGARVVPLERLLAGGVAHTTVVVRVMGETSRHI